MLAVTAAGQVEELVSDLFDPGRRVPVLVVTTRHGERAPLVDVDQLAADLAAAPELGVAAVHVLETGPLTWELAGRLPDGLGVFGGASRIWWPGLESTSPPYRHPLVFAYSTE